MAARSGAGVGIGVTVTLLGVAALALFITTVVFYSRYQRVERDLTTRQAEWDSWVRREEQGSDAIARLRSQAERENRSVVGFLNDSLRQVMQRVTGNPGDTVSRLIEQLDRVEGARTTSLLGVVREREARIADLTARLEQADAARRAALEDLQTESQRVRQKLEAYDRTVATLNADIDRYKQEVEQYRQETNRFKAFMDEQIEKIREGAATREAVLNDRIRRLESENLQLKERISELQAAKSQDILQPTSEFALVDGEILAVNPAAGEVTINRGRRDKVMLGLRFTVYADATAIRPGPDGEYPPGKGQIEVISIGDASATCRVVRETRGNPIVRGDVIANAIYDPRKVYTFLVYGLFDADGDGQATQRETDDIRALIESWGGRVVNDLTGAIDFLVLGQRPIVPPAPGSGAPWPVIEEYMRLDRMAARYDDLFRQAAATSLPVLNENRLYTLIGGRPGVR